MLNLDTTEKLKQEIIRAKEESFKNDSEVYSAHIKIGKYMGEDLYCYARVMDKKTKYVNLIKELKEENEKIVEKYDKLHKCLKSIAYSPPLEKGSWHLMKLAENCLTEISSNEA